MSCRTKLRLGCEISYQDVEVGAASLQVASAEFLALLVQAVWKVEIVESDRNMDTHVVAIAVHCH